MSSVDERRRAAARPPRPSPAPAPRPARARPGGDCPGRDRRSRRAARPPGSRSPPRAAPARSGSGAGSSCAARGAPREPARARRRAWRRRRTRDLLRSTSRCSQVLRFQIPGFPNAAPLVNNPPGARTSGRAWRAPACRRLRAGRSLRSREEPRAPDPRLPLDPAARRAARRGSRARLPSARRPTGSRAGSATSGSRTCGASRSPRVRPRAWCSRCTWVWRRSRVCVGGGFGALLALIAAVSLRAELRRGVLLLSRLLPHPDSLNVVGPRRARVIRRSAWCSRRTSTLRRRAGSSPRPSPISLRARASGARPARRRRPVRTHCPRPRCSPPRPCCSRSWLGAEGWLLGGARAAARPRARGGLRRHAAVGAGPAFAGRQRQRLGGGGHAHLRRAAARAAPGRRRALAASAPARRRSAVAACTPSCRRIPTGRRTAPSS